MDIENIGIGAVLSALLAVGTNLFISQQNRKRDEIKERLEKLYLPMRKILRSPQAMQNKYATFLELEKLYTEYEHLVSPMLIYVFDDIVDTYHSLLNETISEVEIREKLIASSFKNCKDISQQFDALIYDIYGIVGANTEELLRQYRGGFKLHILNFIQSFSSSPYSAKAYKKEYLGYKEDS
jgi:hypothetical protein